LFFTIILQLLAILFLSAHFIRAASLAYTFSIVKSCRKFVMGKLESACPQLFELKPDMIQSGNFGGK